MKKLQIVTLAAGCLALALSCAAPLRSYRVPSTMPRLILIEDQIYDLRESLPDEASSVELHLRDGRIVGGKLLSCNNERIDISPGFTFKTINGKTEKVEERLAVDKAKIMIMKIW